MITVVGEALVDLVIHPASPEPPRAHPGGSPANVAVGLARLGHLVTFITEIGTDDYGALVRDHLVYNGVQLAPGCEVDGPTNRAVAHLDESGSASYEFDISWTVTDLALPPGTTFLHTGSLALALEPGARAVLDLLRRTSNGGFALIGFDPNVRPALAGDRTSAVQRIEEVAALCHVVKMSDEDLGYLFPGASPAEVADRFLGRGVTALAAITLGARGAYVATSHACVELPALTGKVVDTVGAGDAFSAGMIDGLTERVMRPARPIGDQLAAISRLTIDDLAEVARRASVVAAITVSRAGADPPTRAEVDAEVDPTGGSPEPAATRPGDP